MTLKDLKTGQSGIVERLEGTGALRRRLSIWELLPAHGSRSRRSLLWEIRSK